MNLKASIDILITAFEDGIAGGGLRLNAMACHRMISLLKKYKDAIPNA